MQSRQPSGLRGNHCPTLPSGWQLGTVRPRAGPCRRTHLPFVRNKSASGVQIPWDDTDQGGGKGEAKGAAGNAGSDQHPPRLFPVSQKQSPRGQPSVCQGLRHGSGNGGQCGGLWSCRQAKGLGLEVCIQPGACCLGHVPFSAPCQAPGTECDKARHICSPRACTLEGETTSYKHR